VIHAKPQADFLGKHLALLLAKGKPLPEYKFSTSPLLALSMGPKHGVVQIGSIVLGNFMTSLMKSKNLFYQGSWDLMNKTVPK
jgi:NADH dehydrogenase FAD-containing subunit